ncbi:zinc-binding alcohol dehydrogenase family protein [Membranihabitans maritimus]|uniref:zinc-binding alcohol dehydrogenase family protein n=1 Tax=Membranihabitans maritimus TaxID=2904244 RepID=UPI001F371BD2|nr:zinc-binding alcohol dehydrogenase family protein [Membranihabitans maritimus]
MKTIEITEPRVIKWADRQEPECGREEVLLKVNYIGLCGSDLSTYLGENPLVEYPRIPGHEISATIEEVGSHVPDNFRVGDHVTVVPYTHCYQCASCKQKRFNACKYNQTLGVQRDGAMSEYFVVQWQKVLKDNGLNDYQLALVEPLTVGFHAIDNANVLDTDTVMVLGCGMIGTGAILRAAWRGATVIAVDIDDCKLEIAKQLGAHYTINSRNDELHLILDQLTTGFGPTVVVEAAGSPITYRTAIAEVGFSGKVVCIGYTNQEVAFPTKLWVQKELTIMGSRNANPMDFEAVIRYLRTSNLGEKELVTRIIRPEVVGEAMKEWAEKPGGILKILIQFN